MVPLQKYKSHMSPSPVFAPPSVPGGSLSHIPILGY